jgi:hypothetical protein
MADSLKSESLLPNEPVWVRLNPVKGNCREVEETGEGHFLRNALGIIGEDG